MTSLIKDYLQQFIKLRVIHITLNHRTPQKTTGPPSSIVRDAPGKSETIHAITSLSFTLVGKRGLHFTHKVTKLYGHCLSVYFSRGLCWVSSFSSRKGPQYLSHKQ